MKRIFNIMIITIISMFVFIPNVLADDTYEYTITYDANGGKFEDGSKTNQVSHELKTFSPRYSYTENLIETGEKITDYGNNWNYSNIEGTNRGDKSKNHVITIPGATAINVNVYYNSESKENDPICIWEGKGPRYVCSSSSVFSYNDKLLGGQESLTFDINGHTFTKLGNFRHTIQGDSVTFSFASNESNTGAGYGYYAIITSADVDNITGEYKTPINNDSNLVFAGWYYDKECSEDKRVNFDDIRTNTKVYAKYIDISSFHGVMEVVSGDLDTYGSVIKIKNEEFYLIGRENNRLKLFSKYNLGVGTGYDNPTYIQDEEATGVVYDERGSFISDKGSVPFSSSTYWWNSTLKTVNEPYKIESAGPTDWRMEVYDDNASIKQYVDKYVDYLGNQCVDVEGRLLNGKEFEEMGCDYLCADCWIGMFLSLCGANAPVWSKNIAYWTGVSNLYYSNSTMQGIGYKVTGSPIINGRGYGYAPTSVSAGVRPVILLNLDSGDTCYVEPQEEIKEEVKGVEEIKENPKTGVFKNTLSIIVLLVLSLIAYNIVRHIQVFKRY